MGQTSSQSRLAWVDNLRTLMIVPVVNMHAWVTCSHVGSWYRMETPEPAIPVKIFSGRAAKWLSDRSFAV